MIRVEFPEHQRVPVGFQISGHAGAGSAGNDIVCAAVSSAAYMTANTVTEILRVQPEEIEVREGFLRFIVPLSDADSCETVLRGLVLHLNSLAEQYPKNIHISFTEV